MAPSGIGGAVVEFHSPLEDFKRQKTDISKPGQIKPKIISMP